MLKEIDFHVINKYKAQVDAYSFIHGAALTWHKEKLYASFARNKGSKNTLGDVRVKGAHLRVESGPTWNLTVQWLGH